MDMYQPQPYWYYPQPQMDQLGQLRQQQMMPQQPVVPQQPIDDRNFVPGREAAEAYLVAANNKVHLWDSTQNVVYEKSTDANGRYYPMVTYDLVRRDDQAQAPAQAVDYEARIKALEDKIAALEKKEADSNV